MNNDELYRELHNLAYGIAERSLAYLISEANLDPQVAAEQELDFGLIDTMAEIVLQARGGRALLQARPSLPEKLTR